MADDMSKRCVVCKEGETSGKLVQNPDIELILSIKDSIKRAELGEFNLKHLAEYLTGLSETELKLVRYHSRSRKEVVHIKMTERAEKRSRSPHDASLTHKVGRPSTSRDSSRPKRTSTKNQG